MATPDRGLPRAFLTQEAFWETVVELIPPGDSGTLGYAVGRRLFSLTQLFRLFEFSLPLVL